MHCSSLEQLLGHQPAWRGEAIYNGTSHGSLEMIGSLTQSAGSACTPNLLTLPPKQKALRHLYFRV